MKREPVTFRLTLIKYQGVRVFFDPLSKRAICDLEVINLSQGSSVELVRQGHSLAKAIVTECGGIKDSSPAFMGPRLLVKPDKRYLRRESTPEHKFAEKIRADLRGLHLGDELLLTIVQHPVIADKCHRWPLIRWYHLATHENCDKALEIYRLAQRLTKRRLAAT